MRTWTGYMLVASLSGTTPFVAAQGPGDERFGDAIGCTGQSASRVSSNLDCGEKVYGGTITTRTEVATPPMVITLPDVVIADCEATISLEYTQRGSLARVDGRIDNTTCPASTGSFIVSLRTSSDDFEQTTHEFPETWQRVDNQPVAFSRDYEIGDNVDLIRVRTVKSVCKCSAVPE